MNIILLKPSEVIEQQTEGNTSKEATLSKNDERSVHILKHLRKKSGDSVFAGIIGGRRGKAAVKINDNGSITLLLQNDDADSGDTNTEPEITIILALPFPARLKALWSVLSSFCAVTRVIVVKGMLSNDAFCETSALQPKIYQPLIEKGMSQGVRTRPVHVNVCVGEIVTKELLFKLGVLKESTNEHGTARIFLDCGDETAIPPPIREVVLKHCSASRVPKSIIALGPERGWTEEEAKLFVDDCKFEPATLGTSILRVDTAAIACVGIVSAALDECQHRRKEDESNKKRKS